MTSEILFDLRGAVLVVTFNRPESGNALTSTMAKSLSEKLKTLSEDRTVRALVLCGAGEHFMNGHDMNGYIGDTPALQDQIYQKVQFFYTAIREFQIMDRPVITVAQGRVSGAGFSFMLASDLVIAGHRTVFNTGFLSYAMVPDGGASYFLPRKVGASRAMELLLLSEDFSVESAEKWGLVSRIVDQEKLKEEALIWAEKLASGPTRSFGATKRLISKSFEQDLNAHLSIEAVAWNAAIKTFDFREAMKAFVAGRAPKYNGA